MCKWYIAVLYNIFIIQLDDSFDASVVLSQQVMTILYARSCTTRLINQSQLLEDMSRKVALARCIKKNFEWQTRTDTTLSEVLFSEEPELTSFLNTVPDHYHDEKITPLLRKLEKQCEAARKAPKKPKDEFGFSDDESNDEGSVEIAAVPVTDHLTALRKRYMGLVATMNDTGDIDKSDVTVLSYLFAGRALEDSINNNTTMLDELETQLKKLKRSIAAEKRLNQEHKQLTELLKKKLEETRVQSLKGPGHQVEQLRAALDDQNKKSTQDVAVGLKFIKTTLATFIADTYLKKTTKVTDEEYSDLVDMYGDRIKMLVDDLFHANLAADEESLPPDDVHRYIEYHKEDIPIVQFFLTSNFVVPYPNDGFKIKLKMQLGL